MSLPAGQDAVPQAGSSIAAGASALASAGSGGRLLLASSGATEQLARRLADAVQPGDAILLEGPIGAGKTHFARALIGALQRAAGQAPEEVPSPSFTLVQTYRAGSREVWHADLHRLSGPEEIGELGLDLAFETAICLVEWPDRLGDLAPRDALRLHLEPGAHEESRIATLTATGPRGRALADVATA